ncbi:unnamed protein product [Cylindrotheca closterium]|uniref:L domain-like protein n=1 Tax=Cylindrotheca closterium TaxID=2856 RepID=A0AAD2PU31_9STRA|nr:unnamed protein product [Cylindrotheca closterium]
MDKVYDESPHLPGTGEVVKQQQLNDEESPSSTPIKEKEPHSQSQKTWYRLVVIIFLLFIALCIFIGLYVKELNSKVDEKAAVDSVDSNPSNPPSEDHDEPSPIEDENDDTIGEPNNNPFRDDPKLARLYSALSPVASPTFYMANETVNNTMSEYKAWKWLSEDDFSSDTLDDSTPDWKIIERYALAVFYYATNGEGWINQYNFLSNSSVCNWSGSSTFHFGVRFCSEGSVSMLQLPSNNLEGSLPASIKLLSNLYSLDLPQNRIEGTIPLEISELSKLSSRLDLSYNRLVGSIPPSLGGRMRNLDELLLQYNRLEGEIPDELVLALTSLTTLNLASNLLTSTIPEHIGRLTLLQDLRLNDNRLTGEIPASIGFCRQIHKLHLEQNQLSGDIPETLQNLKNDDAHSFNLYLHTNNFTAGASMEFLCQERGLCSTNMGCSSDCNVECSCCRRCYASGVAMCAKVSPNLENGCRMIMDDNLNKQSSVLQAKNIDDGSNTYLLYDTDFPFVVTDKINIDSEDSAYSVYGSIPSNGGPITYNPQIGVPAVTCQELMTDDWYKMRDDSQLRFMEVPDYPCTEFGKRIIYRLIMEWLYFG